MEKIKIIEVRSDRSIEAVEMLANEIWREHYTSIIGKAQVKYMLEQFQSRSAISDQIKNGILYYLLSEEEGDYIGYLCLKITDQEVFLNRMYIKSDRRGKGFGRQAICFVEEMAKKRKCPKITLRVNKNNTDSIKAYEKNGFKNLGSIVADIGHGFIMDDFKMEKKIILKIKGGA